MKVAFLNPNIPPRAVTLLNRIHKNKKIHVHAVFFAVAQKNRRWKLGSKEYEKITFPYTILKSVSFGFGIKDFHNTYLSRGVFSVLKKVNPDLIVLPGWADVTSLLALIWGKLHGKKVILRTESTERETSWRRTVFFPITKLAVMFSDLILGSSQAAEKYAAAIHPKTAHAHILSTFDTKTFARKVNTQKKKQKNVKKSLKISQRNVVYFNGQLIERKGILQLLKAFSHKKLKNVGLIISGYGPLEKTVSQAAQKQNNIHYLGYAQQTDLPKYYACADIFILPSFEETWGLVVIEGLAAGLPIITSRFVGASEIISQQRGVVMKAVTAGSIIRAVQKILSKNPKARRKMGQENQKYAVGALNHEETARQFIDVFQKLMNSST